MNMEDRQKDVDPPQQCEHGYLTIGDDECPVCHQIGMQEIRNNQIKEASEQHFYWFNEACNALDRMRAIAFTMLTPFYFIKAGLYVSLPALLTSAGLVIMLLLVKLLAKMIGVWPLARAFGLGTRESHYTTLLMATGLTFGTISALFGLENHYIDRTQYTVLVTVVILSAVVPTLIAQAFFLPTRETAETLRPQRARQTAPAPVTSEEHTIQERGE